MKSVKSKIKKHSGMNFMKRIGQYQTRSKKLENEFSEMQQLFSNMVNEIVKLKSAISILKTEISEIKSVISNLENEIPNSKSEKPKIKSVKCALCGNLYEDDDRKLNLCNSCIQMVKKRNEM